MEPKKRLLNAVLPLISVAAFFLGAEGLLWGIGYAPSVNRHGVEIPFWAKHAGTFENALDQLVIKTQRLTDDVKAYRDDLKLFYRLRPEIRISVPFYDLSGKPLSGSFPNWTLVTDARGRRCRPLDSIFRDEKTVRRTVHIAFMGGSALFGWGTDYDKTCAAVLETTLRDYQDGVHFQVTNYAVPGYAMSQQLHILREMVRRRTLPQWIILDATSNCDVKSSLTDHDREKQRLSIPGRLRYFLTKLRLFKLMEMAMIKFLPHATGQDVLLSTTRIPLSIYPEYVHSFINLARENGVSLILVGMCAGGRYVKQLEDVGRNQGIPVINFYELIQNAVAIPEAISFADGEKEMYRQVYTDAILTKDPTLYFLFPDQCHPNPTGHRLLAGRLETIIRSRGAPAQ